MNEIKRKDAGYLLSQILLGVARAKKGEITDLAEWIKSDLDRFGLELPVPCTGEAHDPAVGGQIDNCGVCMRSGTWGWSGRPVKVK